MSSFTMGAGSSVARCSGTTPYRRKAFCTSADPAAGVAVEVAVEVAVGVAVEVPVVVMEEAVEVAVEVLTVGVVARRARGRLDTET